MKKLLFIFSLFGTQWFALFGSDNDNNIQLQINLTPITMSNYIKISTKLGGPLCNIQNNMFTCQIEPNWNGKIFVDYMLNGVTSSKEFTLEKDKTKFDLKCENNQIKIE